MTKQQITLIGAGTLATLLLIVTLAFGSLNPVASVDGASAEGNNFFSSIVSSFGEDEDEDEDEMEDDEMEDEDKGFLAGITSSFGEDENEMEDEYEIEDEDEEEDDD